MKKICRYLEGERTPLFVVIIGRIGSGKTTLAHSIHEYCFPDYNKYELNDPKEIETLPPRSKYYIIFDDFSYKITGRTKEDREKLNMLFRIRHVLESNDIVLVFVVHYLRSLAVFIRSSQVRILTSISEPEIQLYSQEYLFTPSSLWDYLHYYMRYPKRYIILLHSRSGEHIIDITKKEV